MSVAEGIPGNPVFLSIGAAHYFGGVSTKPSVVG